ncbi:MAG: hypothetical protein NZ517_05450, partial [Candidatus Nitrosocaldus sp.]|nr:hypothetical protein [Candidatus Nitrosocaldus sp.]
KGKILKDGTLVADGKAYILKEFKPYLLRNGWTTYKCIIVDARTEQVYRFNGNNEIVGEIIDPTIAKRWLTSTVLQKLAATKPDTFLLVMVFFMGMFAFMLLSQYLIKGG